MRAVYALYDTGDAAQRAVNGLRAAGVRTDDITVISARPMEEHEFSQIGRGTKLWYIASGGGLVGLLFGTWLTRFTEIDWPIVVGNMPVVTWWTNLIVIFELTMLGAIVATVVGLIVAARLMRRTPALYDPRVTEGKILVGVDGLDNRQGADEDAIERVLRETSGTAPAIVP